MWRYFVGAAGALCMTLAGMFLYRGLAAPEAEAIPRPPVATHGAAPSPSPLPEIVPQATEKTLEEKRFDRYDRDHDEIVTREEYLRSRRTSFARLDTNRDGKLSFEEWAITTTTRYADADKDRNGTLTRAEFAATRTRSSRPRPTPSCRCASDDD
ncbi:MAG: histidine kinase [Sphingomonas sp.]|nr:histidine kinase [Sphingomonas sp.]